jgi:lipopolysaccharide assembly outer membrane protein LptD (OstA)
LRFDLDSRLSDALLFNIAATYDIYDNGLETLNLEVGVKPIPNLSLFVERRFITNQSKFLLGSMYWALNKGWQIRATTRYDELAEKFLENDLSLLYNNPCKCWGFSFDFINRNIISGSVNRPENKFLFTFTLRGIGTQGVGDENLGHIHREF